jgi:hypothetical protein
MVGRILGTGAGIFLILLVLLLRGIPVLFFIKILPLVLLLLLGAAFIYAGLTPD